MTTARDRPPEEAHEDTSFGRGLRVLLTVADRGEIRADELSTLLDTPLSTIYRYLRTLSDFGFIDRQGAGYRLGPRLAINSGATVTAEELMRAADPVLRLLADETGETAVVVRRVGMSAVCLHEVVSSHPLRVTLAPGTALPLHRGALGKALLAFAPDDVMEEALGAESLTVDGTGADEAPQLRADLADIVTSGIARSVGEVVSGSVALAVPILRDDGIVGAIGVIGPETRCDLAWRRRVTRLLPGGAVSIAAALATGGTGRSSQDSHDPE